MVIAGPVRLGRKTKDLVRLLRPGDIAAICHRDLDAVAAQALVEANVACVLDAEPSFTGRFPNLGPKILTDAGIPLLDSLGETLFRDLYDGDVVEVVDHEIIRGPQVVARGRLVTGDRVYRHLQQSRRRMDILLKRFIRNTMEVVGAEKNAIFGDLDLAGLRTPISGRQVVVVARGYGYKEDLHALAGYIRRTHPVLVAVDGGADALLEMGLRPELIVGDMDSVSDRALSGGAELVVHAYPDGRSPGAARLQGMEVPALAVRSPGTSEDLAILLAYQHGAELIVVVGAHWTMLDFLEKGRRGMASTFLVRLKAAPVMVDARGLSRLYQPDSGLRWVAGVGLAALFPLAALIGVSPWARTLARVLSIRLRTTFAGLW